MTRGDPESPLRWTSKSTRKLAAKLTARGKPISPQKVGQLLFALGYRYCRAALADPALADDIQQQVFIEAFRDLPRFAGRSTVRTWLLGIARHRVLDAAKRRRRSRSHLDDACAPTAAEHADPRALPGEWIDETRLLSVLVECVYELEEPARTSVLLRFQQGLSYDEMAQISGENPGTLQARVSRALRRLRDLIEARFER